MATELASGYVNVGVKYDDAVKRINADLVGLERTAATTSSRVSAHIASGFRSAASEASRSGATASQAFSEGLTRGISQAFSGVSGHLGSFQGAADKTFSAVTSKAGLAALGIAGVGIAAIGVTKQLYDLGAQWDDLADTITGNTGKMGADLDVIVDRVKEVGRQSALSFGELGSIASGVDRSLNLTGASATRMVDQLAKVQQVTKQVVDTQALGKTFRLFDISDIQSEVSVLENLTAASQATQKPINELIQGVLSAGRAGKEAGLGLNETLGIVLALNEAGVGIEKAGPSLAIALRNWSKEGRNANVALGETITQIKAFIDSGNDAAATKLATETFGRGYIDFLRAIKDRNLDVDKLNESLAKLGNTTGLLDKQAEATADWHERLQGIQHTLSEKLAPIAEAVFGTINFNLEMVTGNFGQLESAESKARKELELLGKVPIDPNSALGRILLPAGAVVPPGPLPPPTTAPGQPTTGLGPNFYLDWYPKQGDTSKTPKLPEAPVLPINLALPPEMTSLPQTDEIINAENSYIDARHEVEEKRARLQQLEQSGLATDSQLQEIRNDVYTSERSLASAERGLWQTRQDLFDKETKRIEDENKKAEDERKKLEDERKKLQSSFSGGSLIDFLLFLAFQKPLNDLALNNLPTTTASSTVSPLSNLIGSTSGTIGGVPAPLGVPTIGGYPTGTTGPAPGPTTTAPPGASTAAMPAGLTGPQQAAYKAMIAAGYSPSEWPALKSILDNESSGGDPTAVNPKSGAFGMFQFLGHENDKYGAMGGYSSDPTQQSAAGLQYIRDRYQTPSAAWDFWQKNHWYQSGGGIPGFGSGDRVPILGEPGEHMFSVDDVDAMGGQDAVYAFRKALHMQGGGYIGDPEELRRRRGNFNPGIAIDTSRAHVGGRANDIPYGQQALNQMMAGWQYLSAMGAASPIPGISSRWGQALARIPRFQTGGAVETFGLPTPDTPFPPWVYQLGAQFGLTPNTRAGHQTTERPDIGAAPNPQHLIRGIDWTGSPANQRAFAEYLAGSGAAEQVIYSDEQGNIGYPANVDYSQDWAGHRTHVHTRFSRAPGAAAAGPGGGGGAQVPMIGPGAAPPLNLSVPSSPASAEAPLTPEQAALEAIRMSGYIPAGAGGGGQAGSSFASGVYGLVGSGIKWGINTAIDAAEAAAMAAISMAATGAAGAGGSAGGPGGGGAAVAGQAISAAAAPAISFGADTAKQLAGKLVDYGTNLAGIWTDAGAEIFMPFGVPRFFQTDPNQFMPRISSLPIAQTTGEKAQQAHLGSGAPPGPGQDPGGPVQPGQLPLAQPVAPTFKPAEAGGITAAPINIGAIGTALGKALQPGGPQEGPQVPAQAQPQAPQQGPQVPAQAQPQPQTAPAAPGSQGQAPSFADELLRNMGIFDEGGWLGPVGVNMTGRPEPVLSHSQNANLQAIANMPAGELDSESARNGTTYDYRVVLQNVTVKDVDELQRKVGDRQRLQMMRHSGRPSMGGP